MRFEALRFSKICCLALLLVGCTQDGNDDNAPERTATDSVDVICTAWVHRAIVQELARGELTSQLLAPPEGLNWRNRNSFFPTGKELTVAQSARLFLNNGRAVPYCSWPEKVTLDESRVCWTSRKFSLDDYIPVKQLGVVHSHGNEPSHAHDYLVPYCWHNPRLLSLQVEVIAGSLIELKPELTNAIQAGRKKMVEELNELAKKAHSLGQELKNKWVVRLATPDLLFFCKSLNLEAEFELWMDSPENDDWSGRMAELQSKTAEGSWTLLLWPGDVPEQLERHANSSINIVGIDMMEGVVSVDNNSLADRLDGNLNRLGDAAREYASVAGGEGRPHGSNGRIESPSPVDH